MLTVILFFFFFINAFANVLFWVNLWQLKEYRLDRLYVHLKDTQQGRNIVFSIQTFLIGLAFGLAFLSIFFDSISLYFPFFVCLVLGALTVRIFSFALNRRLKRPVFTAKAAGITTLSLLIIIFLTLLPLTDISLWALIVLFLTPFIVGFCIFLFAFPTEIYTDIYIQKAKEKRKKLNKLQVIAVSGSYGKSSTKEVIAEVLSKKYHVVKTAFSNNTPLVVAKTILKKLDNDTDFFIVELGAYKKGEIKQLASMVGPTISVTTSVSDQHLALYGGMDEVIASELELIRELPKGSLVLLNGNSKGVVKMVEKIKNMRVVWYKSSSKLSSTNSISATNIKPFSKGVVWDYLYKKKTFHIISSLLGAHTVENILPAVFLGHYFGLQEQEIKKILHNLSPLPKTMEIKAVLPGVTIIDDSFNASPESVMSASQYLTHAIKRKFFVLSPLIELGAMSKVRHQEIGESLAHVDFLFVTNKNYLNDIKTGIAKKKGKTKIITGSYKYLAKQLREMLTKGDTVIFEGKEAGIVLQLL